MNPQKIAFLVDSCADLGPELIAGKPVFSAPLRVVCVDGEFSDGVDIDAEDVYRRQARGELPRTSLPDLMAVGRALDAAKAAGYERVIALPLSSGLSGTYNMVRLLCESRDDLEIRVFDTKSGSVAIGITVLQLWEDIQGGMEWDRLVGERAPFLLANTFPYFSVDTLEYLQKGGRIGKITALAGTMLSIKPIISFSPEGELASVAKVRGRKQVIGKLVELVRSNVRDPRTPFNLAAANGGAPGEMEELKRRLMEAMPGCRHVWTARMDATLSVYIGSGVLGAGIQFLE